MTFRSLPRVWSGTTDEVVSVVTTTVDRVCNVKQDLWRLRWLSWLRTSRFKTPTTRTFGSMKTTTLSLMYTKHYSVHLRTHTHVMYVSMSTFILTPRPKKLLPCSYSYTFLQRCILLTNFLRPNVFVLFIRVLGGFTINTPYFPPILSKHMVIKLITIKYIQFVLFCGIILTDKTQNTM